MAEYVSQIALPITLAFIMLAMGLGLTLFDFKRLYVQPKATLLGLALQLFLLPCIALILAYVLNLSMMASAGLFLVSLCPGGATSNLFSYLAKGDVALSITLTAITSIIVPISLPILFMSYLSFLGDGHSNFSMPISIMIKQLLLVTFTPVLVGMLLRHYCPSFINAIERPIKLIATLTMLTVIVLLLITNLTVVQKMVSASGLAALLLCTITLSVSYVIARKLLTNNHHVKTIAIEAGVQNAGTAMMVALTLLEQPALAVIPLMYGLLMNIPALCFVFWSQRNISK